MSTATKKKKTVAKPKAAAKPKAPAKKPEGFSAEHPAPEPEAASAVAETAPEPTPAAPAPKKLTLEERVHRLEQFVRHDLNAILDQPERTPGGPAGDGAGEEQVVGNT